MVMSVGGLARYLAALGAQAGGDFAFVDMLWCDPTLRHLVRAVTRDVRRFRGSASRLAYVVSCWRWPDARMLLIRNRRRWSCVIAAFVPYAVFHLLLQETRHDALRAAAPRAGRVSRRAARSMPLRRWAAGSARRHRDGSALAVSVPAAMAYGAEAHPAFRALRDMLAASRAKSRRRGLRASCARSCARGCRPRGRCRSSSRRSVRMARCRSSTGGVEATQPVWFLADPRRTDLALFDPQSRRDVTQYRWRGRRLAWRRRHATNQCRLVSHRRPRDGLRDVAGRCRSRQAASRVAEQAGLDRRSDRGVRPPAVGAGLASSSVVAIWRRRPAARRCSSLTIDGQPYRLVAIRSSGRARTFSVSSRSRRGGRRVPAPTRRCAFRRKRTTPGAPTAACRHPAVRSAIRSRR